MRVQIDGALEYFALAASQAAFLDVGDGAARCVLVPPEAVRDRFSNGRRSGFRIPWA